MKRSKRFHWFNLVILALAIALALVAAAPLWGPGIVNTRGGGDSPFLLRRTLEMAESLRHGIFPVRWMSHAAYDLGYPFFNHYAALPYYLSGGLTALGLSPPVAIQATQTLGFMLAALTMLFWFRRLFQNRVAALLATAAYTFAPFHLVNVYVRGDSLSEFYAFVWYPLILWALDRLAARFTTRRVLGAALAYSALILTHNVSALIFSPFAFLYALVVTWDRAKTSRRHPASALDFHVSRIVLPFALGILLSAWFWLPAIAEIRYGQMGPAFTEGYFNYENHFRSTNLVQRSLRFNYEIAGRVDEAGPFAMGLAQAGLALIGSVLLSWRVLRQARRQRSGVERKSKILAREVYLLIGLALATVMITPLSRPLWRYLPLLATTQFPWRFLSVQALFTAAVSGALADRSGGRPIHVSTLIGLLCTAALILSALLSLHPDRLRITAEDVTWDNLLLYESFTGNIGTTIRHEYLPADVVPRLYISGAVVDGVNSMMPKVDGNARLLATLTRRTPVQQVWRVTLDRAATVAFPLHWWPGWQARIDGERADARPLTGSGRLAVDMPAGPHVVTLRLRNTPLRTAALLVSAATLLGCAIWLLSSAPALSFYPLSFVILSLVISIILCALFQQPPTAGPATFFDFVQMPYPHRGPVDFGAAQLTTVRAPDTAVPGETLNIELAWADVTAPLTGTLRLVSPATPRHNVPLTLAETSFAVKAVQTARLALPGDLARGLYLLQLRVHDDAEERFGQTAQGRGMGAFYIGAVRVPGGPPLPADAPQVAALGDGALTLHAVEAHQVDPRTLALAFTWSTRGTPRNWSLSLRLRDATGRQLVQMDLQPGYGYLPTTLWTPGEQVVDHLRMPLPEGLAPGAYTLSVITYLQATMQEGGEVDVPVRLTDATRREPPDTAICEAGGLRLTEVRLPDAVDEGEALTFDAVWSAVEVPEVALTARWEVLNGLGKVVASQEGAVAPGSETSLWPKHAWVRAPVRLEMPPSLPHSPYRLQLTLLAEGKAPVTCSVVEGLPIVARERVFEPPPLPFAQEAFFGEVLRLLGYDLVSQKNEIRLTLWWQAVQTPARDYKRFVHLYDVDSGVVLAQDDAMPRDWTYPTGAWVAGEVVSETVTLTTEGIPPGEYRLGVGWYEAETGTRLPAFDSQGERIPEDRVMLAWGPY
ncbi:MAG: 6-pyruvoyl-tetrahydropterin synthase-related protein [Anaerolineae bacterium]